MPTAPKQPGQIIYKLIYSEKRTQQITFNNMQQRVV